MHGFTPWACTGRAANKPAWTYAGAAIDLDFAADRYWTSGSTALAAILTVARASAGYVSDLAGNWTQVPADTLRRSDKGALIEEQRTNVVPWCRDLTKVSWNKVSATVALDQTGIDGTPNSASKITATATNGRVLQSCVVASSARYQSAFVKRLTGSGTVQMTMDSGSTWTAVTVTGSWTRVTIPTQTLGNPNVGIRLVTSGDAIAVDFIQNEDSKFATSPILTAGAAATRNADVVTVTSVPSLSSFSVFGKGTASIGLTAAANPVLATLDRGSSVDEAMLYMDRTSGKIVMQLNVGGVNQYASALTDAADLRNPPAQARAGHAIADGGQAASVNGTAPTLKTISPIFVPTRITIGGRSTVQQWSGYCERFAVFPTRLSDAALAALTA